MKSSANSSSNAHAITHLLSCYMCGEIRDTAWTRFMNVMDSENFSTEDRSALASFFKDALDEYGSDQDIYIPMLSEARTFNDGLRLAA